MRMRLAVRATAIACALGFLAVTPPATANHGLPYHWSRTSPTVTAVAQVYFEDTTGTRWPVARGVLKWDDRPGFYRPYYKAANTCDETVVHCVPVRSGNYGASGWYGATTYNVYRTTNHVVHNSMLVRFNNSYATSERFREHVVCHELGHASGALDENPTANASCMNDQAAHLLPTSHDFDMIIAAYDH